MEMTSRPEVDESLRRGFELAWAKGHLPPIEHFLPPEDDPHFLPTLEELVAIDLEFRWKADQPAIARVEEYLERFPRLNQPPIVLRLLRQEFLGRQRRGDSPDPSEYRARFPALVVTGQELQETLDQYRTQPPARSQPGTPEVPGYQVLGLLGRGGMGVVYRARHVQLDRLVALKMLRDGAANLEDLPRFRTEAQAVARFQHPNIVQIYEVGEHQGQPYLALELVDGTSLDRKLAGTPQPPRQAAELAAVLARAVHAVHERGIIHRDLKPGNVLLTAEGAPKIGDFGLAKQLDVDAGQTRSGDVLGTPAYMAPEQAAGRTREVGPAADVYALGAILYEMLTGRPPFLGVTAWDIIPQILSAEPVPPRRLQPTVPRDLETICLKCLRKEPDRRYAGARALAEDLHRFLEGEPVQARPVGRVERLWRWGRRKPLSAALLAALVLAVASGFAGMTYLWRLAESRLARADRESVRAGREAKRARRAVNEFFTEVSEKEDLKNHGLEEFRKRLLQTARDYYDEFVQDEDQGPEPGLRAERGGSYRRLARITAEIGSQPEAIRLHEKARDVFEELARANPDAPEYPFEQARTLNGLALLYQAADRVDEARAAFDTGLRLVDRLVRDHPDNADFRKEQCFLLNNLGLFHRATDEPLLARGAYEKAEGALAALGAEHRDVPEYRGMLAGICSNLAGVYGDLREGGRAAVAYQKALDIQGELIRDHPHLPKYRADLSNTLNNRGVFRLEAGTPVLAEKDFQEAFKLRETLAREHPGVFDYQAGLLGSWNNLALVYGKTGRPDQARKASQAALDLCDGLAARHPTVPGYRRLQAHCLNLLGNLHVDGGRPDQAESFYQTALIVRDKLAKDHPDVRDYAADLSASYFNLANLYKETGRPSAAAASYHEALKILDRLVGEAVFLTRYQKKQVTCWYNLALAYEKEGRGNDALAAYRKAIDLREVLVRRHPGDAEFALDLGKARGHLGLVLAAKGDLAAALENYDESIRRLEAVLEPVQTRALATGYLQEILAARASTLVQRDRHAEALADVDRALGLETGLRQLPLWLQRTSVFTQLRERALERAQKGEHEWAAGAAAVLGGHPSHLPDNHYAAACVYARCVEAAARDEKAAPADRKKRGEDYAARAVAALARSAAAGYFASADHFRKLQTDPHLGAISPREDFRNLQAELARK
jgi:serine/threonine protein kinase/tetratricopeptide (TPR) repeat protein